jgi:hypothetical protein
MKNIFAALFIFIAFTANAQYYYKDIIGVKESADIIKHYKLNNVRKVVLVSYDADGTKSDDFFVEQTFIPSSQILKTVTRSGVSDGSVLTSYSDDKGNIVKTIDSSESLVSTTIYNYNDAGLLSSIVSTSADNVKGFIITEEHLWEYQNGKIWRMLRIKDKIDTSFVQFKFDEAGNIIEENSIRKGVATQPVFYYYDGNNRLTDIVRFNNKSKRLLPEYLFEYSPANQVIQKITVPSNSSNYLIWRYQYDNNGLKIKEAIYNKQKELTGKIEYQYIKG